MACTLTLDLTAESRRIREEALERLRTGLATGGVSVVINRTTGAVAFKGWTENGGMADACAIRRLMAEGSAPLRMALAAAERQVGRRANLATASHSHDGGATWGSH